MAGQFLVPQFIDVETKIIGSITTRQFLIMMIVGMIDFILYKLLFFNTFVVVSVILTALFGIVAFFKVNGMAFHFFALNLIQTLKRPRLRVWNKVVVTSLPKAEKAEVKKEFLPKPAPPGSRLTSLSLIVNTGGAYQEEE